MDITHFVVIRYLSLKGLTTNEIHEDMMVTPGENDPSNNIVKDWDAEFNRGRGSEEDDTSRRRPATVTTHETIDKIHDIIMADRRVTGYYIVTELDIS